VRREGDVTGDPESRQGSAPERGAARPADGRDPAVGEMTRCLIRVRDSRDREAFGRLFEHFAPRVKGVLLRGGLDAATAEDVVQDVMLKVWSHADRFDPSRAEASGWIYAMMRNRQIDVIRRQSRPVPADLPSETSGDRVEDDVILSESRQRLSEEIAALSAVQRNLIERAYLGGLTQRELQVETGLPLGTIKSRIRLGLARLRRSLDGESKA